MVSANGGHRDGFGPGSLVSSRPIGKSGGGKGGSCGENGRRGGFMAGRCGGWFAKRSIDSNEGQGIGGFVVLGGRSSRESKNVRGEVGGVEKMSSTGPSLWLEVRSVWKAVLVPVEERVAEKHLEMMEESFRNRLEVIELDMEALSILDSYMRIMVFARIHFIE
nr:hypothetical protein [Tanacetum cinerariifolium]